MRRSELALIVAFGLLGCGGAEELEPVGGSRGNPAQSAAGEAGEASEEPRANEPLPDLEAPPTRVALEGRRLVAIGDLHGDLASARDALRLAGVIDGDDRWSGGTTVVVQVGDQLDRGDDEEAILELLERLAAEAEAEGGAVYALLGNHELMNARGDFRYVTRGGWRDFADTAHDDDDPRLARFPPAQRGQAAAFAPGGEWAARLANHNLVMVVGDTAFAHGGILPDHVEYGLDALNRDARRFLRGEARLPSILTSQDSPQWSRHYSVRPDAGDCAQLERVLEALGVRRLVVAHTPQPSGIEGACADRVYCVDTGLAAHYGGPTEVLEVSGDRVRVLRDAPRPSAP